MRTSDIVVVGSYNSDLILSVARLPAPGETCLARGRSTSPGGKGSNQAIQAARCGASVAMLAAIGCDSEGDQAMALWAEAGIDAGGVARLADHGTGMALILVDAAGENSIVVEAGANAHLTPEHMEAAATRLSAAKLVVAQLETPVDTTRRAFQLARAAGAHTLLNAAPAPDATDTGLLALTDILVVNQGEGAALTGCDDLAAIGTGLLAKVRTAVVVTLGRDGAALFEKHGRVRRVESHAVEAVDTTGAGDAFIGAFAARLTAGYDLTSSLAWGIAAGALACTAEGASPSFADGRQISALARADSTEGC